MAQVPTNLSEVLTRTVVRMIDDIAACTSSNTYLSTMPNQLPPNPDEVMFEVSPSGTYSFDQDIITGAGRNALQCSTEILVTIHVTHQNDEMGRDTEYLTNSTRGALVHVGSVLESLSLHNLLIANGNEILIHPMRPTTGWIPPKDDRRKGFVTLAFSVEFDWDISSDIYTP